MIDLYELSQLVAFADFGVIGLVGLYFRGKAREVRFGKPRSVRFFARKRFKER